MPRDTLRIVSKFTNFSATKDRASQQVGGLPRFLRSQYTAFMTNSFERRRQSITRTVITEQTETLSEFSRRFRSRLIVILSAMLPGVFLPQSALSSYHCLNNQRRGKSRGRAMWHWCARMLTISLFGAKNSQLFSIDTYVRRF